jgi:transposase-like protein
VELARLRERPLREIAASLGISESCLRNWIAQADVNAGSRPGLSSDERAELAALRRDKRRLELEKRDPQTGRGLLRAGERPPKMTYPVVHELAADQQIPVVVAQ